MPTHLTTQATEALPLTDALRRPLRDLRISLIDRCNFRCRYCMPEKHYPEHYTFLKDGEWLTFGEIIRLVKLFQQCGVRKVRLTGGEPLLRPRLSELVKALSRVPGLEDIALTTNGVMLKSLAADLRRAGLHRLTVSLDSLDPAVFHRMNGGRAMVEDVLAGLEAARQAGFTTIKINCVPQSHVNAESLLALVEHFRFSGDILRFIEYMDVGNLNDWTPGDVIPSAKILKRIRQHYPLEPVESEYYGEVASRYRFRDGGGEVGFISSVSQPFCRTCTRARLSTDGKLYTCLFSGEGTDLKTLLRSGATDAELLAVIRRVWTQRVDRYSENRTLFRALPESEKKVEMYRVGG